MNEGQMKKWIDEAEYEALLMKWRFEPVGSPWFQGEIGEYYEEAMARKRSTIPSEELVSASKRVGWDV